MEFHGLPWNLECANFDDTSSSMEFHEFHGTWRAPISMTLAVPWKSMELGMRKFRWHKQFHNNKYLLTSTIFFASTFLYAWFVAVWLCTNIDRCVPPFRLPVTSFIKEVNQRLVKRPLVFNGCLANRGLSSLVKEATDCQYFTWGRTPSKQIWN